MLTPHMGEIGLFSFAFAPKGWALANGQILPIAQNQALFSLMGTTYGGDGQHTFALPDLRGRAVVHRSGAFTQGQVGGQEAVTLTMQNLPPHNHAMMATSAAATATSPGDSVLHGAMSGDTLYAQSTNGTVSSFGPSSFQGGGQAHANMMPFLVINYSVALQGIFPSRN